MTTFQGPAAVIAEDGSETAANARLRKDASGTWEGTLAVTSEDEWTSVRNLMQARLRLPDGSEGAFVVPSLPGPFSPGAGGTMRIEGNGAAPF